MIRQTLLSLCVAAIAATTFCVAAQTTDTGGLLRDMQGKTLYTFDKDVGGVSACYDGCAAVWPPYLAPQGAKASDKLTLHARKDGKVQWGVSGKPLYYYAADTAAGDAKGDGVGGAWHVVRK
jgi:predicted lipoprotein with Yx(FWY)xxD motif